MDKSKELIIKFSHEYYKLNLIPSKVTLLETFVKQSEELSESFVEYDTRYILENENKFKYYQLPEAKPMIVLLFYVESSNTTFTTVRPYNYFKYKWYSENRGKKFKIEILKTT
ncbi:MAG: hypothetical protein KDK54_19700 [Leptospiraceae bacterium]|nr:hypothetical protein [Leptospiraceae bacterium]